MTTSPDSGALYEEALALEARIEAYTTKHLTFLRAQRDRELALLTDGGFLAGVDGEVRIHAASLRANQLLQEELPDLFEALDLEHAALEGIRARNSAIVAAGWAEQLSMQSWAREMREGTRELKGTKELGEGS